jgi:hypothetical protein
VFCYGTVELQRRLLNIVLYIQVLRLKLWLYWMLLCMLPLARSEQISIYFLKLINDRFLPLSLELFFYLLIPHLDTIEQFVPKTVRNM